MSLINALQNPDLFDHPVTEFGVIETHISWVLLTGPFAYKIKKPVNYGFLDFSTLEKRHQYCQEELRLNRRLAPQLYLDVIAIYGTEEKPGLLADGSVIEYAVKMCQFEQSAQLDHVLENEKLQSHHIDILASRVADFHLSTNVVPKEDLYGDAEHVAEPVVENFTQIRSCFDEPQLTTMLDTLQDWCDKQLKKLHNRFVQRKANGFIRACHGDMHLRNMALIDDDIVIFDCIEFNKNFYHIDVMSEVAFLVMDLEDRDQAAFARQFLNQYLEITGDYEGLILLQFYKVYRAMVRAKVDALRTRQENINTPEYKETYQDFLQYIKLAENYTKPTSPCLLISHGFSGTGKTTCAKEIIKKFPAIQIRSDVERKRIFNQTTQEQDSYEVGKGLYSPQVSEQTYQHLATLSKTLLEAGYSVLIDAANLKQAERQAFVQLAQSTGSPFVVLDYQASPAILRKRISHRSIYERDASDATIDVLEHQLENHEPISNDEAAATLTINTEQVLDVNNIVAQLKERCSCLNPGATAINKIDSKTGFRAEK